MLQKALIESRKHHNFDVVYGFPNQQAEAVLQRAGYRFVGNMVRLTRPLRSHYYLSRRIPGGLLARTLAGVVDPVLYWTSKEIRHKTNRKLKFEVSLDFDERFDDFWARCAHRGLIVGERNSAYLCCRYAHCPHKGYRVNAVTDGSSREILGYVVWYTVGSSIHIAELWDDGERGVMDCLLSEFDSSVRKMQIQFRFPISAGKLWRTSSSNTGLPFVKGKRSCLFSLTRMRLGLLIYRTQKTGVCSRGTPTLNLRPLRSSPVDS
jgi:hypothetical protein